MSLIDQTAMSCKLPIIATGGMMDGADIAEVLNRGTTAVQLGTAFMCCPEAGTPTPYRGALLNAAEGTAITRAMRTAAAKDGVRRYMALWAGEGYARSRSLPAAQLIAALVSELSAAGRCCIALFVKIWEVSVEKRARG